jgi:hypothetical protein
MQALGDLTDREDALARASDIVSPVELFLTGNVMYPLTHVTHVLYLSGG